MISERTVGRLALYRRIVSQLAAENMAYLHSHELANRAGVTAAQVRRDLMVVGHAGSPNKGYTVTNLLAGLVDFLSGPGGQRLALVGVGNLGQALLSYFVGGRSHLSIVAAFDVDQKKCGRIICGCRCYAMEELDTVVREERLHLAIVAVPAPAAQKVSDDLVHLGIKGLVNFSPIPIHVPQDIYVENVDLTMSLEKVAYFARQSLDATLQATSSRSG